MSKLVSIIIRGKNEEDWLGLCLRAINNQLFKDYEIIYVDNESTDASINVAKAFKVNKIRKIKKFLPGNAINIGIKASEGKYIVIISAHCIPKDNNWLTQMVNSIKQKNIAGVYGRQIPMESTSSDDARDLLITFGNEDRIQTIDPFFHNANSIIKKSVWEKVNFDNNITNIEDRDWAKKVLDLKYLIKYDSSASVYHFHGLHQHNNYESFRASAVNNLIKKINNDDTGDIPEWLKVNKRVCPLVFYGKVKDVQKEFHRYLKSNKDISETDLFYYGSSDPGIKGITYLKRRVSRKAPFYKFTSDILELVNTSTGFSPEAISFVDLTYKYFIKDSFIQNKEKIFTNNIHFSTFAFLDKGDIWTSNNKKIKPLKEMFDSNTQFLRVAFGQSSIIRCSTIRIHKSNASNGFANTFKNIKFLIR